MLIGVGGIFVETLDDVIITLARRTRRTSRRCSKLARLAVAGGRAGARPGDVAAVARMACAIGDVLLGRPDLDEIEVNPLRRRPPARSRSTPGSSWHDA